MKGNKVAVPEFGAASSRHAGQARLSASHVPICCLVVLHLLLSFACVGPLPPRALALADLQAINDPRQPDCELDLSVIDRVNGFQYGVSYSNSGTIAGYLVNLKTRQSHLINLHEDRKRDIVRLIDFTKANWAVLAQKNLDPHGGWGPPVLVHEDARLVIDVNCRSIHHVASWAVLHGQQVSPEVQHIIGIMDAVFKPEIVNSSHATIGIPPSAP
jgi:hypothetical protein